MSPADCETCGKPIAADAPGGLCPSCLLRTAIEYGPSQALAPLLPRLRYFGDYELLEEVARGGMGVVYRARQVSLDRTVALKMMRPGLLSTDTEIRRFLSEARTAASLRHPHIVAIYEAGEFDGLHYFSMDFVEGTNLAAIVREGPLTSEEAARYVRILAETVQFAHARGILHRDLKPSNVLVDSAGRPSITDFGVARRIEGAETLSGAGAIVGTPAYMAPEQASGDSERVTAASDVYSLGAILYELLTGAPPFRAASQVEVVRMVIDTEPKRPRSLNPAIDAQVETICLRCIAKDPAKRFRSAGELADALKRYLGNEPVHPPLRRSVWPVFGAVLCLIAVAIVWVALRPGKPTVVKTTKAKKTEVVAHPPDQDQIKPRAEKALARTTATTAPKPVPDRAPVVEPQPVLAPIALAASVSPARGSGYNQVFSFHYAVGPEAEAPVAIEVDFGDNAGARHCNILVEPETGRVQLQVNPAGGPGLRTGGQIGTLNRIENSICAVDLSDAMLARQADMTELRLPMTFQPSFNGVSTIRSWLWKKQGVPRLETRLETTVTGQWTVGPDPAQ